MDLNSMLLGGPGGLWNQGADKAAEQIRLGEQQDRELAQALSQIRDRDARLAMAQDLHPTDLAYQGSRAANEAALARQNNVKATLDEMFGQSRETDAQAKRRGEIAKQDQDLAASGLKNFLDEFATMAGARQGAGVQPQEVMGMAKKYGLDVNSPQVQFLAGAPPAHQNEIAQRIAASSVGQRQRDQENQRMMDRQAAHDRATEQRRLKEIALQGAYKAEQIELRAKVLAQTERVPRTFAEAIIKLKEQNRTLAGSGDPDAAAKIAANNQVIDQYGGMLDNAMKLGLRVIPDGSGSFMIEPPQKSNLSDPLPGGADAASRAQEGKVNAGAGSTPTVVRGPNGETISVSGFPVKRQ